MNTQKNASHRFFTLILGLLAAGALLVPVLASAAPPPPDPPPVPAGNLFTEYAVGLGMAGYGAWTFWRAKRGSKKND